MAEITDLVVTDASNTGRWPENMQFSAVNNAGRSDEGLLARWYKDMDSSVTSSGSSNAYTATSNRTIVALNDNTMMVFTANHTCTGASTFSLNGLAAKTIRRFAGDNLSSGDITSGQPVSLIYKSSPDCWYMMNAAAAIATGMTSIDFTENASPGTPGANVARFHAGDSGSGTYMAYRNSAGNDFILGAPSQAVVEALNAQYVQTPAMQHFHPGHPKCGGGWNGNGVVAITSGDYGLSSISDNGTGLYTLTFDTAFNDTNYWQNAWCRSYSGSATAVVTGSVAGTKTASTFQARTAETSTGNAVDPTEICMNWWGDRA